MRNEPLSIEDFSTADRSRVLKLIGPLTITTLYKFQDLVRSGSSPKLIVDFTNVPYIDSAGVGALVGAYVRQHKEGHSLALAGVNERVRGTLKVTQVDKFFAYIESVPRTA